MKTFLFTCITIAASSTFAFGTRWSCATDHLTTSYAMIEHDDHFELQGWHHNGTAFMPIHQGLITTTDLVTLSEDAKVFAPMGERYALKFSKSQCQVIQNDWSCLILEPTQINFLMVKSIGFKAYEQTTITRTATIKTYVLRLSLELPGIAYTLPMEYSARNCAHYPSPYLKN